MNMRLVFCLCVAVASAVLAHSALSQQPARVALLIGNANYPDASTPISTTFRHARTLADEFRRTEFDVDLKENVGREDMQRAIDAFIGKIRPGMVALFYFMLIRPQKRREKERRALLETTGHDLAQLLTEPERAPPRQLS